MAYKTGDYQKSILESITQKGHLGTSQVAQHTFD